MMKSNTNTENSFRTAVSFLPLAAASVFLLVYYLPVLSHYFYIEDYFFLGPAERYGFSLGNILSVNDIHFEPLYRFLFALEYRFFGYHPRGYYAVALALQGINLVLAAAWFCRLFGHSGMGRFAGALFTVSAAHWRAVMNLAELCHLLAMMFFLMTCLCFLNYVFQRKKIWMAAAVFFHWGTMLSHELGLEIPVLFPLMLMMIRPRPTSGFGAGFRMVLPFIVSVMLYFGLRLFWFPPEGLSGILSGGMLDFLVRGLTASAWVVRGILEHILISFSAGYGVPEEWRAVYAVFFSFFAAQAVWYLRKDFAPWRDLMLGLAAWVFLLYFTPAMFRVRDYGGPEVFLRYSRFLYYPNLPAAGIFALFYGVLLTAFLRRRQYGRLAGLALLLALAVFSNGGQVKKHQREMGRMTQANKAAENRFVSQLSVLLRDGPPVFQLADVLYAGRFFPQRAVLIPFHFDPSEREEMDLRIRWVMWGRDAVRPDLPAYRITKSGDIVSFRRPVK